MAKTYEFLTDDLQAFIRAQRLFFVATAPLSAEGDLNLSPKGLDCFRKDEPTAGERKLHSPDSDVYGVDP